MPVKPHAREDAQDLPRLHQAVSGGTTRGSDYQTPADARAHQTRSLIADR